MPIFSPFRARALRDDAHLSREQLAHRIGRTTSTVHKIETGDISPSLITLSAMAKALGCSVAEFFDEDETDLAALIADGTRPSDLGPDVDGWLRTTLAAMPPMSDETARRVSAVLFPSAARTRQVAP